MAIKKTDINILDLPLVENVAAGDYLVVETPDGTSIIDYENFIIGPENTTLSVTVSSLTNDVLDLAQNITTTIDNLSTDIYENFKQLYIGTAEITIDSGHTASSYLSPRPPAEVELSFNDFIIVPSNQAACKYPCYITQVDTSEDGRGTFSVYAPIKRIAAAAAGQIESNLIIDNSVAYNTYFNSANGIDFISGAQNQVVSSFNLEYFFNQLDRYLLDKYSVSTDNIGNVSIQTDELDIVAEDLEQAPSYLIKVVKTY